MIEQNLFVWAAFLITFLILGLHLLGVLRETRHTQKVVAQQFTRQTLQANTRFTSVRGSLHSVTKDSSGKQ